LKDVTVPFLEGYEQFMLTNGRSITTIGIYLRSLRTIINVARADKLMSEEKYPFGMKSHKKYEIPRANNIKKALDETAITKIINYEPLTNDEAKARDLWLFSFFCNGMNMADIFSLKYENIDGEFIQFHRKKTIRTRKVQEPIELFISKPVAAIIEKWGSENRLKKGYIFGIFNETMTPEEMYLKTHHTIRSINAYMKRIARRLGIETNITTYVARHSWATTLLRKGISTAYISKGFGHASFSTTEQYLGGFTQDQKKNVAELLTNLGDE
jgi:integrase